jgi:hypothetical protein
VRGDENVSASLLRGITHYSLAAQVNVPSGHYFPLEVLKGVGVITTQMCGMNCDYFVFGVSFAGEQGFYEGVARRPSDSAILPRGRSMVQICVPCVVMHEAMS